MLGFTCFRVLGFLGFGLQVSEFRARLFWASLLWFAGVVGLIRSCAVSLLQSGLAVPVACVVLLKVP